LSNHSPENLARAICRAHDFYVAAILAFRKLPNRETRQRLDEAAIRHADLMMVLFDPARPYVAPGRKGRKPSIENAEAAP
jgi:hypothetical protein